MKNKKIAFLFFLILFLSICIPGSLFARNVAISNFYVSDLDTTNKTLKFNFDISWNNSWRDSESYDAVWFFVKYKYSDSTNIQQLHCTLMASGINPSGTSCGSGTGIEIIVPTDKKGCFIQLAQGRGSDLNVNLVSVKGIQLTWDYGKDLSDNTGSTTTYEPYLTEYPYSAFAIEMVYIPTAAFYAGAYNETALDYPFRANNATGSGPFMISSEGELSFGNSTTLPFYGGGDTNCNAGQAFALPATYPKGYHGFYLMKYEISQQQYVDFFNSLTYWQKVGGGIVNLPLLFKSSERIIQGRNALYVNDDWDEMWVANKREGDRACNYMSWNELCAYADWAALRPMTELEYEKACRGTVNPSYIGDNDMVSGVGVSTYGTSEYYLAGLNCTSGYEDGTEISDYNETSASYSAFNFGDNNLTGGDEGNGPVRGGLFSSTAISWSDAASPRLESGSGYYGNMELGGNIIEMCVSVSCMPYSLGFQGTHGDGYLSYNGAATNSDWPNFVNNPDDMDVSGVPVDDTGGNITHSGGYTIHTFTGNGTYHANADHNVEVLVVAGGGGGGGDDMAAANGGGGAGGLIHESSFAVSTGDISVTVGAGGAGGTSSHPNGYQGNNSTFSSLDAVGGGYGGGGRYGGNGGNGGSGGGAQWGDGALGGSGTSGQGYDGGDKGPGQYGGAGGGGAGAEGGTTFSPYGGGAGGAGLDMSSYFGISVGISGWFAGGGGGGASGSPGPGVGGQGGGGSGGQGGNGASAVTNTGGGGGGSGYGGFSGGNGGSGIVIVKYLPGGDIGVIGRGGYYGDTNSSKLCTADRPAPSGYSFGGNGYEYTGGRLARTAP